MGRDLGAHLCLPSFIGPRALARPMSASPSGSAQVKGPPPGALFSAMFAPSPHPKAGRVR